MAAGESDFDRGNPFATCDANGKPVEYRISSPVASRAIYDKVVQDEYKESVRRGNIQRMFDNYLPYDQEKRKAQGRANETNINFGELRGFIEARAAVVQDMALDTTPLVELRPKNPAIAGPDAVRLSEIISEEFSQVLRENRRFLPALTLMVQQADLFGLGPITWKTPKDYQPTALRRGQLKFPQNTSAFSNEAELLMVDYTLPAAYLFGLFDNVAASEAEGWNMKALKRFLVSVFVAKNPTESEPSNLMGTTTIESLIALWRQNRGVDESQFQTVHVIADYVREVSGKRRISHSIRAANATDMRLPTDRPEEPVQEEWLFRKKDAFDNMDQCLIWLPSTAAEVEARGLRGIASQLYPLVDRSNKYLCRVIDSADFYSGITLQSKMPNQREVSIQAVGPLNLIDASVTALPNQQAMPNFQMLVGIRELFNNVGTNSASGLRGPVAAPERVYAGADRKTRDQVSMEAQAMDKAERSTHIIRTIVFDKVFSESFRRFAVLVKEKAYDEFPEVKEFVERCEGYGLGYDEIVAHMESVKVYMCRDLVTGGSEAKAGALAQILGSFGGNLDEQGRLAVTRDIVKLTLGRMSADRYRPEVDRSQLPSDSASIATLENNFLKSGMPVMVGMDQLHWSHIPVHAEVIREIVEMFQQGQTQDPQRDLDVLTATTDHIREHLQFGRTQTNMEDSAKEIERNLTSLSPVVKGLTLAAASIEKERKAEEAKQQAEMEKLQQAASEAELRPKLAKVEQDGRLAMREQDLKHEARMADIANRGEAQAYVAGAKADTARQAAEAKIEGQVPEAVTRTSAMLGSLLQGSQISSGRQPTTEALGQPPPQPLFTDEDLNAVGEE